MQRTSLHVKLRPGLVKGLEALSRKWETSVDELVEESILFCYQFAFYNLSIPQEFALKKFQRGDISLGKFAEEMGMNVPKTRKWLEEHSIPHNNSFVEDDVKMSEKSSKK